MNRIEWTPPLPTIEMLHKSNRNFQRILKGILFSYKGGYVTNRAIIRNHRSAASADPDFYFAKHAVDKILLLPGILLAWDDIERILGFQLELLKQSMFDRIIRITGINIQSKRKHSLT
jgi:hypothetical protein